MEWLPELTHLLVLSPLERELAGRPTSVRAITGYLLQGLRPDLADALRSAASTANKTWFGPRGRFRRHDSAWQVADTPLPFDPRDLTTGDRPHPPVARRISETEGDVARQ